MEYARAWEREPFAWCIREGRARVDCPEAPGFHRIYSYVERGFYAAQLDRLFAIFPREQVMLIGSERLEAEPNAVLAEICDFMGAAHPAPGADLQADRLRPSHHRGRPGPSARPLPSRHGAVRGPGRLLRRALA